MRPEHVFNSHYVRCLVIWIITCRQNRDVTGVETIGDFRLNIYLKRAGSSLVWDVDPNCTIWVVGDSPIKIFGCFPQAFDVVLRFKICREFINQFFES